MTMIFGDEDFVSMRKLSQPGNELFHLASCPVITDVSSVNQDISVRYSDLAMKSMGIRNANNPHPRSIVHHAWNCAQNLA